MRFLGCSSILPNLTDHIAMGVFDVFQIPYSALQPEHEAAIAEAARGGAGIVIRGGVARGEPGAGQGAADVWKLWEHARMDELLEGMSATEFLLRFTITNPDMHTTIVGTLNPAHLYATSQQCCKGRCLLPCTPKPGAASLRLLLPTRPCRLQSQEPIERDGSTTASEEKEEELVASFSRCQHGSPWP